MTELSIETQKIGNKAVKDVQRKSLENDITVTEDKYIEGTL